MRIWRLALPLALTAARAGVRPPPLVVLPTLPRVRLEVARDRVVVVQDVNLARGEWTGSDYDLFVAFGAPGPPRAIDARLCGAAEGGRDPPADAWWEAVSLEPAPRRPRSAHLLLGSPTMAGVVLHVRGRAFQRSLLASGVARLRIRSLYDPPEEDARTGREVIVRLGVREGPPLALGRLEVVAVEDDDYLQGAEAHLCGPEADPYPLAVVTLPATNRPEGPAPVAPVLSVRHAGDDLCVRYWSR